MGAAGCAIEISGPQDGPRLVTCAKVSVEGDGRPFDDFYVQPHSVSVGDDPNAGLALDYLTKEQIKPVASASDRYETDAIGLLAIIRDKPNCSKRWVRAHSGINATRTDLVLGVLLEDERIVNLGTSTSWQLRVSGEAS